MDKQHRRIIPLKETLEQNNLMNSPQQVYNVDETEVPLDSKANVV